MNDFKRNNNLPKNEDGSVKPCGRRKGVVNKKRHLKVEQVLLELSVNPVQELRKLMSNFNPSE